MCRSSFAVLSALIFSAGVANGAAELKAEATTYNGASLSVVRLDRPEFHLSLHWLKPDGTPYSTLQALREAIQRQGQTFFMATNSGIYSKTLKPLGLHVENGKTLIPVNTSHAPGGNFSMVPNGIFLVAKSGAKVIETSEYAQIKVPPIFATQSGPLLVHNGKIHPGFQKGSSNRKLRSGVGVDRKGQVVFAISKGGISFYDFAEFFQTRLDCPNALYLDGTISQLLMGNDPAQGAPVPFVGIWAVTN